jgi:hypothetical protein
MKRAAAVVVIALLAASCRTVTPEQSFAQLESRLLEMNPIDVTFALKSSGAVESASNGTLKATGRDVIVDAETAIAGSSTKRSHALTDHGSPVSQKRLLILGWTRMGLLHNMVMLASGKPIMHNVEQSVRVANVRWNRGERMFAFDVLIDGTKTADARLWLDASGRPMRRLQTVQFPNGAMHVEEQYTWR